MALIKRRTRGKQPVRHRMRLDRETNGTLYAYAHLLGEPTEYVLNQVIDTVHGKDKDFLPWRAEPRIPSWRGQACLRRHATRPPRANAVAAPASSHWGPVPRSLGLARCSAPCSTPARSSR